jgi:hypothetical protein
MPNSAGFQLRQARLRSRLTFRDVQRACEEIAAAKGRVDYLLPISRLSEIENHGAQPTIFRIYSLCTIYRLSFAQVLSMYQVDLSELSADQERFQPKSVMMLTHLLGEGEEPDKPVSQLLAVRHNMPAPLRPTELIGNSNDVPVWLLDRIRHSGFRYGFMGLDDSTMAPMIPPGSILQIDMTIRRVEEGQWPSEHQRPIYFIEHSDGYSCSWASQHAKKLILQPHPMSPCPPRVYSTPQEAEVIGQVVGVAKSLIPIPRSSGPLAAGRESSVSR